MGCSSDGARMDVAWHAPCSEAVWSSKEGGWADGMNMDLSSQAPCSEAVRSSRAQAGLMA